ncbi:serine hydrolase domain-containing protein [Rhodanobacter sp. DHB23]|uniref:serine hydrolase domain-containing protein n=1 Tax=Rhodanobacter sp. DHB23 TaxID=2775923 RepID=UPI00178315E2|nr:serine hydrolase domain-containing protein [Rhodanobacter sp. DHB23]MBD8873259.1 beta-lactamase family protein [Rhodanobacter sp. DHB23]
MRIRHLALACATGLACTGIHAAQAQPQPQVRTQARTQAPQPTVAANILPPASADIAAEELPQARIQAALADYQRWLGELDARHGAAGLATAVVIDDKVVFEHTQGYANAATQAPVTPATVFRLASLSKAFATAATGIEVDHGKLGWDTKLADVLPYFKLKDVQATEQATVADILGQRVGLPHNTYDNLLEDDVPYDELVRKLDEVDNTCAPGLCYGYQNVAFSLIGDVLFARTGNFFDKLVDRDIFKPLQMQTASYGRSALESSKSWARPHHAGRNHGWIPFEPKEAYYRVAPAAGVNASIRDMELWLIAQMGGRQDVLPTALLDVLHAPGVATPTEVRATPWRHARLSNASYALGWRVYTYSGETLFFHAGAVAGYRTMIGFFPKYHAGVVTLWNSSGAMPSGLMPMVFDDLLGLPHVDWAGVESATPARSAPAKARPARKARKHPQH